MKQILLGLLLLISGSVAAQILADFETPESSVILRGDSSRIIDNPSLTGNPSKQVATYNKAAGNWRSITFELGRKVNIRKNTVLSFLINSTTQGRVFVKVWDGNTLLKEAWAPDYQSMPTANSWTQTTFDITSLQDQSFDRIEIFGSVDNEAAATIYFDNLRMYNPLSLNGEPIPAFTTTKNPDGSHTFDASESTDLDGTIVKYLWRFNGEQPTESATAILKKMFDKAGDYEVSLEITDNDQKKAVTKQSIYVFAPSVSISPPKTTKSTLFVNQKIEMTFLIDKTYTNPYDEEEVRVDAQVTFPDGSQKTIPCFYAEKGIYKNNVWSADPNIHNWTLRFSSAAAGTHKIKILLTDKTRTVSAEAADFTVLASDEKGIVEINKDDTQAYNHRTGESFTPLGINVGWDNMSNYHAILSNLSDAGANFVRYWVVPFNKQALEWKDDGYTHGIGRYSQAAAAFNDSLFTLAESKGIYLQMVLFQHGMFSENVNSNWADNPYNVTRNGPLNRAEEFFYNESAKKSAKKLLRYIVARYGYSQKLFAWELFNEVQFTGVHNLQTDTWKQGVLTWHDEMGNYIKNLDEFDHIVTTSASDQQLFQMDSLSGVDVLQYHVYNPNLASTMLQKNADFKEKLKKPIFCGEYGLDVQTADTPVDLQRNLIWAGIFDRVPHAMWLWKNYTNRNWSDLFTHPAKFLKEHNLLPTGNVSEWAFASDNAAFKTVGNKSGKDYYGMVFEPTTGSSNLGMTLDLSTIENGTYQTEVIDIISGRKSKNERTLAGIGRKMTLPNLEKGQVIVLKYMGPALEPVAAVQSKAVVGQNTAWQINSRNSYIPAGQAVSYTWQFLKQPTGSTLSVNSTNPIEFELTPVVPGEYELVLGLKAGSKISYDTLKTYVNATPVAVLSAPKVSKFQQDVELSAGNSSDLEKDVLQYQWKITTPTGSTKVIDFGTQRTIRFVTDESGKYLVELVVRDSYTQSKAVSTEISTEFALSTFLLDSEVKIYPVPAHDFVTLEVSGEMVNKKVTVELINAGGEVLSLFSVLKSAKIPLKVSPGTYFLRVSDGIRIETKKITVE